MFRNSALLRCKRRLASLTLALSAFAADASARDQLYGALTDQALLHCEDLRWHGQTQQANTCYGALQNSQAPAGIRAEAAWALGDMQGANNYFRQAVEAQPMDAMLRVRWGELFMQTYQYDEADKLFDEAIELDKKNAWAKIGSAQALANGNGDDEVINKLMEEVLSGIMPAGVRYRGLLMMVQTALNKDRFDEAEKHIKEAREVAEEGKLSQLELYALEAANAFMQLQPYQSFIDKALAENPAYGEAWATLGHYAMITRRYRETGEFYEKAVKLEPNNWSARLELGQNYLRLNQISKGVDEINASFKGDAFNPATINLMRMLEVFINKMEVFSYPNPPDGPIPRLQVRLNKSESNVLKDYVSELTLKAMSHYENRYRFAPKEPVVVEVYPNHEDFIVRSIGMPGVGLLGVTFGYLLAMDSPTAHARAESYHWGTTLWHEMSHVYTVEASNHLVPRWYTEGISVFEEWRTGPIPGRKIPLDVFKAMSENKFLPIAELDDGFMRPSYEGQVIVSYMQGGLVIDFIDKSFGVEKVVNMLYRFGKGEKLATAVPAELGISVDELNDRFTKFIDQEYGTLVKKLPQWFELQKQAFEALEKQDWKAAVAAGKQAVEIFPDYVEADSPYIALARGYARLNETENEFKTLETFWKQGGYASRALLALANDYTERNNNEQAFKVLQDVVWADPFSIELHQRLGDLYLTHNDAARALREFQVLLSLNPPDKAEANLKVATAYKALNDKEKSMQYVMSALEIAPQYRPAQSLLLDLSRNK